MKVIKLYAIEYDILTLYRNAKTPAQRDLAGYIIKSGNIHNPILGGAFHFLREVEPAMWNDEIYEIISYVDDMTKRKIMHVTQLAIKGELKKFTMNEKQISDIIKYLCEQM